MKKNKKVTCMVVVICLILLCMMMLLSGCSNSSVSIPKEELQGKAYNKIQSEYDYLNSSTIEFSGDSYNEADQTYDMQYRLSSTSTHGYKKIYLIFRARSVYDSSTRTWSDVYLTLTEREEVPDISCIGSMYAASPYGGDVTVQLLSVDRITKTITANIDANNLTVRAENYTDHTKYTVNIHEQNIKGTYQFSSGAWTQEEDYMIYLGNHDGQDIVLSIRYLSMFGYDEPSYILYVGMEDDLLRSGEINLN